MTYPHPTEYQDPTAEQPLRLFPARMEAESEDEAAYKAGIKKMYGEWYKKVMEAYGAETAETDNTRHRERIRPSLPQL